ncbi:HAD superfamily hydrolase (TIGR01509 family) [Aliiruegeria haliotis]|uniref:HAD superfamily hydrolase (TIGR01509 family) n=1 Tax=Aliiruegeria haliotis TaxID=1280846 RepID=A0A2T0RZB3_9RHOB|nr:HAD family phosphatase [Aliiruegeria haliotis]PRY26490.1 HAD superfamily hydrolase (TIGR01509 family) [Aliiruegeria haliotis]
MDSSARTTSDRPQALLFDMDGLLLDTERLAMEAFVEATEPFDLPDPAGIFLTLVGSSGAQTRARIAEVFGPSVDIAVFSQRWDGGFHERMQQHVPVKSGVRETLAELAGRGWTMSVVTSSSTVPARAILDRAGLLEHFRDVVGGDCVTAHKPDPAPYLLGAERCGVVATACHAFEDSDKGVAAAAAAGCAVSQIPDLRPPDAPLPNLGQGVFPSLAEAVTAAGLLD